MAKRTLNPVEKARKEARKKELKKNKKQRQQVRANLPTKVDTKPPKADQGNSSAIKPPPVSLPTGPPPDLKPLVNSPDDARFVPAQTASNTRSLSLKPSHAGKSHDTTPKPSVIESKPIMFVSKVTKFVPSSVRQKINPKPRIL